MESTNIPVEIEAKFKQATVKGGVAVLQFEVDTEDSAAFDAIRKSGEEVWLSIQSKQPQILFVSHDGDAAVIDEAITERKYNQMLNEEVR